MKWVNMLVMMVLLYVLPWCTSGPVDREQHVTEIPHTFSYVSDLDSDIADMRTIRERGGRVASQLEKEEDITPSSVVSYC